jgi:hypothetical protein
LAEFGNWTLAMAIDNQPVVSSQAFTWAMFDGLSNLVDDVNDLQHRRLTVAQLAVAKQGVLHDGRA